MEKIKNYFSHNDIKTKFRIFEKRCRVNFMKNARNTKSTRLHTEKHRYRSKVKKYTARSIKSHYIEDIEKCDKYNFNLDHIVPIMYGFYKNIPPELIGDFRNLQVIPKLKNIEKGKKLPRYYDKNLFKGYINERV